jgi:hypothetical protein
MEGFLIFCLIVVLLVRWVYLRNRFATLESRLETLSARLAGQDLALTRLDRMFPREEVKPPPARPVTPVAEPPAEPRSAEPRPAPPPAPPPFVERPSAPPAPLFASAAAPAPPRSTEEWETLLGGNWLNKLGVFVLVVGIALALGYSFTRVGPLGRVLTSVAFSVAMLVAGAVWERREKYRVFARGLMGGGWAALYITVYAMHAVDAVRVIPDPVTAFLLLLGVAAGMIVHSLRYRSETVTGVAYFVAFGTLAITEAARFPVLALIPLAGSLLYVAHRFSWPRMVLLGLISTYGVCVLRGDSGSPLWQAQAIFIVFWLLFEIFDILHPGAWLLPLNAAGFLGLSLIKWSHDAPDKLWILLAASAAAYLASAATRARTGQWQGAATLTAGLAASAAFQKLDHQWVATALVVEAELFYLAGVRLGARYLRWLGTALFGVEMGRLLASDTVTLPVAAWVPVASVDAAVFYANRALFAADSFFGFAAAGMLALVVGNEVPEPYRSVGWLALAAGAFAVGWWRRLLDFRLQGYLLGILGVTVAVFQSHEPALGAAAVVSYAAVLCALQSAPDRLHEAEREALCMAGSAAATLASVALVWRMVPGEYLGLAWMGLAIVLLELGLRGLPGYFRRQAYAVAALGVIRLWLFNLPAIENSGSWIPRLVPAGAALLAYAIAARVRRDEGGVVFLAASSLGTIFLLDASWALLPPQAVAPMWAAWALALLFAGRGWDIAPLRWQSYVAAPLAFAWCWFVNFAGTEATSAVWTGSLVAVCFYAAMLLVQRGSRERLYYSLLGTTLTALLLYYNISGSMLTVAWGIEGAALLASGFPLGDRVLRISGLALLLSCILKLFVWDLRHLETLPRIFSFIVLGLILLAVSWVYTRYRERVSRFL